MRHVSRVVLIFQLTLLLTFTPLTAGQSETPTPTDKTENARLHWRLAHFAPNSGSVKVLLNAAPSGVQGVSFGAISEWQALDAGTHDFNVVAAGDAALVLWAFSGMTLSAGQWLTLVITEDENTQIVRGHTLFENFAPLPENSTRLTLFYAISDPSSANLLIDGEAVVTDVVYPAETVNLALQSVDLTSSTYRLEIAAADVSNALILDAGQVELLPNRNYFAAAINTSEDPRLVLVATEVERFNALGTVNGRALMRLAHLSSGTPPLDVYVDDRLLATLYFPEFSGWTAFPTTNMRMTVTLAGEPLSNALLPPFDVILAPSSYTTLAFIGSLANNTLTAHILIEEFTALAPGFVRVSVLNAYPGSGAIDIQSADGVPYLQALGYPGFFGGNNGFNHIILEHGVYDLQAVKSESREVLFDLPGTSLFAGRNYFIAAINADPAFVLTFSDLAETQVLMNAP